MLFFKQRKSAAPSHSRASTTITSIIDAEEDLRCLHALRGTLHNLNKAKQAGMRNLDSTIIAVRNACAQRFKNVYGRSALEKDFEYQRTMLSMFFTATSSTYEEGSKANHEEDENQEIDDDSELTSTF